MRAGNARAWDREDWCEVAGFPQTGSGKIRKFRLRDDYVAGKHEEIGPETGTGNQAPLISPQSV